MRSSVLRNVDLPQPDGPMRAVMLFSGMSMQILVSAWWLPYQRFKSLTEMMLFIVHSSS